MYIFVLISASLNKNLLTYIHGRCPGGAELRGAELRSGLRYPFVRILRCGGRKTLCGVGGEPGEAFRGRSPTCRIVREQIAFFHGGDDDGPFREF